MMQARSLIDLVLPGSSRRRLSILIYHRVLPAPDPLFPTAVDTRSFDRQMATLSACWKVIPLADAVHALRRGKLPQRAACITFDDGYADNAELALPILLRHRLPATFFIATGFLNGGRMWNDTIIEMVRGTGAAFLELDEIGLGQLRIDTLAQKRQAIGSLLARLKYLPPAERDAQVAAICARHPAPLPDGLMMTSDQVRELHSAGMEIAAHTVRHPILASLDMDAARKEIAAGRETLESMVRAPVRLFAYPNGVPGKDYLPQHASMVRQLGFTAAVSTAWGAARADDDLYQLPRFTPWDSDPLRFALRLAGNRLRTGTFA